MRGSYARQLEIIFLKGLSIWKDLEELSGSDLNISGNYMSRPR